MSPLEQCAAAVQRHAPLLNAVAPVLGVTADPRVPFDTVRAPEGRRYSPGQRRATVGLTPAERALGAAVPSLQPRRR